MEDELQQDRVKPNLKWEITGSTISTLGLIFAVLLLNPGRGPITILLFLALLFLAVLSIASLLIQLIGTRILNKQYSMIRTLYTAVLIASGVVFLVGLQTLGQLQIIDVILVIIFEALLNFYIIRRF